MLITIMINCNQIYQSYNWSNSICPDNHRFHKKRERFKKKKKWPLLKKLPMDREMQKMILISIRSSDSIRKYDDQNITTNSLAISLVTWKTMKLTLSLSIFRWEIPPSEQTIYSWKRIKIEYVWISIFPFCMQYFFFFQICMNFILFIFSIHCWN